MGYTKYAQTDVPNGKINYKVSHINFKTRTYFFKAKMTIVIITNIKFPQSVKQQIIYVKTSSLFMSYAKLLKAFNRI